MNQNKNFEGNFSAGFNRIVIIANDATSYITVACAISWATTTLPHLYQIYNNNNNNNNKSIKLLESNLDFIPIVILQSPNPNQVILSANECIKRGIEQSSTLQSFISLTQDLKEFSLAMQQVFFTIPDHLVNHNNNNNKEEEEKKRYFIPDIKNDLYVYISAWNNIENVYQDILYYLTSIKSDYIGRIILLSDNYTQESILQITQNILPKWKIFESFVTCFAPPSLHLKLTQSFVSQCSEIKGTLECISLGVAMGIIKYLPVAFREIVQVIPLDIAANSALISVIFALQEYNEQVSSYSIESINYLNINLNNSNKDDNILVWGMFAEYLMDYYGRLGSNVKKMFPLLQLMDPQPTLQVSARVSDWVNYGISLMRPFQCYYNNAAIQRRKKILNYFNNDSSTNQKIHDTIKNIDKTIQGINNSIMNPSTSSNPINHDKKTNTSLSILLNFKNNNYKILLDKVAKDPLLRSLYFYISLKNVKWDLYIKIIAQSVIKHIVWKMYKSPIILPNPLPQYHNDIIFHGNRRALPTILSPRKFFTDMHWVIRCGMKSNGIRVNTSPGLTKESQKYILSHPDVVKLMNEAAESENIPSKILQKRAERILKSVGDNLNQIQVRTLGFLVRQVLFQLYDEVNLNTTAFERLSLALSTPKVHVVLLPSHRSYVDFLIMTYLLVVMNFPPPHVCAGDNFLKLGPIAKLLRGSGAFFMRRSFKNDKLYYLLFKIYVQELVRGRQVLEFFIEGMRSRTGKTLPPKLGILKFITDTFFEEEEENNNNNNNTNTLEDILLIPISMSYDELLEVKLYANEQLGVAKPAENISNLLRARSILNKRHGKIHVHIGEPLSLRSFKENPNKYPLSFAFIEKEEIQIQEEKKNIIIQSQNIKNQQTPSNVLTNLAWHITHNIQNNTIITPTAIVASILSVFTSKSFSISFEELEKYISWLHNHIIKRKGALSIDCANKDSKIILEKGIYYLSNFLKISETNIKNILVHQDLTSIMSISICSNQLIHIFVDEAIIAVIAKVYGNYDSKKQILNIETNILKNESEILRQLLSAEFQDYLPLCPFDFTTWFRYAVDKLLSHNNDNNYDNDNDNNNTNNNNTNKNILFSSESKNSIISIQLTQIFKYLISILLPFIESMYIISLSVCSISESTSFDGLLYKNLLLKTCRECGLNFYNNKKGLILYPQSCGSESLKNALYGFMKLSNIKEDMNLKEPTYILYYSNSNSSSNFLTQMKAIQQQVKKIYTFLLDKTQFNNNNNINNNNNNNEEEEKSLQDALVKLYRENLAGKQILSKV